MEQINRFLKNPRGARFPGRFERVRHVEKINNTTYKVDSWVEATNSFGATLRNKWQMTWQQQGDEWIIVSLVFDGERIV